MIFYPPDLDAKEWEIVERIDEMRGRLEHLGTPKVWGGLLRRTLFARALRGSNTIEGYNVTFDDALAAYDGDEPMDADAESRAAILGYRQAMTYILQIANDPNVEISTNLISALHFMIIGYDLSKHPGRFRTGYVGIRDGTSGEVVYEGPEADEVPKLVEDLVHSLRGSSPTPPVVRAAMAHLNLTMIHPFLDGNGRVARCLQTLTLAMMGHTSPYSLSIEEYLGRNTREYYAVLAEVGEGSWKPMNNCKSWVRFCLKAHYRQAMTVIQRMSIMERLCDSIEAELARLGLPERALMPVTSASFGHKIRNSSYRAMAEVSAGVAKADLKALSDAGVLEPAGERRGRYYTATERVAGIRLRLGQPQRVPDPFEKLPVKGAFLPGMEAYVAGTEE